MKELVTKRAKECSKRGDFLLHGGPHPNSDQHRFRAVIAEQFACPVLANSQGPSRKDANVTFRNFVELRGSIQTLYADVTNICCCSGRHCGFEWFRNSYQVPVLWQIERPAAL